MNRLPTDSNRRRGLAVLITAALVLSTVSTVTPALARSQGGPVADVLTTLNEILAVLKPAPGPVVLTTGVVSVSEHEAIHCGFTNVGNTTISNEITRIIKWDGTVVWESDEPNAVAAGTSGGGVTLFMGEAAVRCEFSFDGVPNSARASIAVGPSDSAAARVILEAR